MVLASLHGSPLARESSIKPSLAMGLYMKVTFYIVYSSVKQGPTSYSTCLFVGMCEVEDLTPLWQCHGNA